MLLGLIKLHTLIFRNIQNKPFFQFVDDGPSLDRCWEPLRYVAVAFPAGPWPRSGKRAFTVGRWFLLHESLLRHWICSCAPSACVDKKNPHVRYFIQCEVCKVQLLRSTVPLDCTYVLRISLQIEQHPNRILFDPLAKSSTLQFLCLYASASSTLAVRQFSAPYFSRCASYRRDRLTSFDNLLLSSSTYFTASIGIHIVSSIGMYGGFFLK